MLALKVEEVAIYYNTKFVARNDAIYLRVVLSRSGWNYLFLTRVKS